MRDRPLEIVLATDSAVPSGVGEHMLTLAGALGLAYYYRGLIKRPF